MPTPYRRRHSDHHAHCLHQPTTEETLSFLYTMVQPSSKVQGGMVPSPKVQGAREMLVSHSCTSTSVGYRTPRRQRRHQSCACDHNIIITILIRFTSPSPARCFRDDTHDRRAFENFSWCLQRTTSKVDTDCCILGVVRQLYKRGRLFCLQIPLWCVWWLYRYGYCDSENKQTKDLGKADMVVSKYVS